MKKNVFALAAGLASIVAAPAFAAPVVIQNGYVQAGVSDYGTLGSNSNTPPGILFDATGSGNYGVNDFLTPGTPFEGFYINSSRGGYFSNNTGYTNFNSGSPASLTGSSASWGGLSYDGLLSADITYNLTNISGRQVIAIHSVFTNLGGALSGVQFLRTLDPDPDVNAFGSYDTNNVVLSNDQACGTGTMSGQTICIYSSSAYAHKAGVSYSWSTNPADFLAGVNDGNGDYTIGIGFDIGNVAAGGSFTLDYAYVLGASLDIARGGDKVPEPASLALLGTGLFGLVAARRRKSKA